MDMIEVLMDKLRKEMTSRVPVQTLYATCKEVDLEEGTMTAEAEEIEYFEVMLGLDGDITVPAIGATVLLGLVGNNTQATFLIATDQVQQRKVNGDQYGGLAKARDILQAINALQRDVNLLKHQVGAWVPVPNDGGGALKAGLAAWAGQALVESPEGAFENTIVQHG